MSVKSPAQCLASKDKIMGFSFLEAEVFKEASADASS
jgi:hypothetical protein